ncbi:unnamed protein product [Rhodiola kirilowii]
MEDAVGPASRWWVWLGVVTGLAGSLAGFVWIAGWGWMLVLAGLLGRLRVWLGCWTALSGAGWGRRAGVACRNRTGLVLKAVGWFGSPGGCCFSVEFRPFWALKMPQMIYSIL